LFAGAVQLSDTCVSPLVAVGALGVFGTVAGVTDADGAEVEDPKALLAVTVNV
jgi:hypothetical protein